MALTERLAILIDADGAKAVSEFKKVGDAANKSLGAAESSSQKLALNLQKVGAASVTAGAVLTVGLAKAAQKFSDLEQATGAVESVFGNATTAVERFAQTSATSIGLSEAKTKQLTSTIGALLQGFGYTQDAAANTSVEVAKLGADLSAAFGGTTEEAISAIGAALRGETDPIERYGAAFNQAAVQAKIAALNLDTSSAAAQQHAKAQASLAIILERTSNVQGQFARESDTLAHKQQVAAATAENAAAKLGEGFAPVMAKVTDLTSSAAGAFGKFDDATKGLASTVAALGAIGLDVGGTLATFVGLALQYKATLAQTAAAKATSAAASAAETAAQGAETAAKAAAISTIIAYTEAQAAATGATYASAGAIRTETVALGTSIPAIEAATAARLELAAASGAAGTSLVSGLASAAGPIAGLAIAMGVAAKAIHSVWNNAEDTDAAIAKLASTTDDQLVPAFQRFSVVAGTTHTLDRFRQIAQESPSLARRIRDAFKDAGKSTKDFDAILGENVDNYIGFANALVTADNALLENAKTAGIATASYKALADTIDSLGSQLDTKFAALDASKAFDAVFQATKKAGSAARDYERDQHDLARAARDVADAQQQVIDAELALAQARLGPTAREREDAELNRAEAALGLKEAYNALTQAQRRLNDARKDGDPQEIRDATLDLEAANLRLRRAQQQNTDAQKDYNDTLSSGAEGSDKVKDASKRLADAQDRLQEAQYQQLQTQKSMTEAAGATNSTLRDQADLAETAAGKFKDLIDKLKASGATTDELVDATKNARDRVDELVRKYGDLNPKLKEYSDYLAQVLATELLLSKANTNDLSRSEIDTILKSGVIVPDRPPSFDTGGVVPGPRGAPMLIQAHGGETVLPTHKSSYSGGGTLVIPVVIDGREVARAVVDYASDAGGINLMVRNPN